MSTDTSIYFQGSNPDLFGSIIRGYKFGRDIKADRDAEALKNAYAQGVTQDANGNLVQDRQKTLAALLPVDAQKALEQDQLFKKNDRAAKEQALEDHMKNVELIARVTNDVKDQQSMDRALFTLSKAGVDVSNVNPKYDPQVIAYYNNLATSLVDQHKQRVQQTELDQKDRALGQKDRELGLEGMKIAADQKKKGNEGFAALDKDYAKDFNDWTSTGRAVVDKNLARLEAAKRSLESDNSLTGSVRGMLPDFIRNATNENAITTRDDVRAAAQGSLKATLGAQFTEKEGERIMNQAYNEKLSPSANIKKIQAAIDEIKKGKLNNDRKAAYFQTYGTLKGLESLPESETSYTRAAYNNQYQQRGASSTVRMRDPQGNIRLIPVDQVDAAKAAGGQAL